MRLDIQLELVIEAMLEFAGVNRELCEVRLKYSALREGVSEIDRRVRSTKQKLCLRCNIPQIFDPQTIEAVWEFVTSAERKHIVAIGLLVEEFVRIRLVGAAIDQHGVFAGLVQRERHIAIILAGFE